MTALSGLSCDDLKFYWKIEPIRKEEEKLRVQIKSEEAALRRIALQREAAIRKEQAGETEGTVKDADQQGLAGGPGSSATGKDEFKSPTKQDDGRQESVLRLRCERRRKKLANLHEEKLEILWNFVKEWPQLELDRLAIEPCLKNVKAVRRLALWYIICPLDLLAEELKWAMAEELMEKFHKPTLSENQDKNETEFTVEEDLHLQDIESCAPDDDDGIAAPPPVNEPAGVTETDVTFRDAPLLPVIAEDTNDAINDPGSQHAFVEDSREDTASPDLTTDSDDILEEDVADIRHAEQEKLAATRDADEKLAVSSPGWTERYLEQVRNIECPWNPEDGAREDWEIARTLQLELEKEAEEAQDEGRYIDNGAVLDLENGEEIQLEANEDDEVKVFNFTLFEEASIPVCSDKLQSSTTTTSVTTTKNRDVVLVTKPPLPGRSRTKSRGSKSNRFSKNRVDKARFDLQEFFSQFDKMDMTETKAKTQKKAKETEELNRSQWKSFQQNAPDTDSPKHLVDYLTAPMVNEVENQNGVPANISFVAEDCNETEKVPVTPSLNCTHLPPDNIVPILDLNGLENSSSDDENFDDAQGVGDTYSGTIILQDFQEHDNVHESAMSACKCYSQKRMRAKNVFTSPTTDDGAKDAVSNRCECNCSKYGKTEEKSPVKNTATHTAHEPIPIEQKHSKDTAKPANNAFDFTFQGAMAGKYCPLSTPRFEDVFPRGAYAPRHPTAFPHPTDPAFNWPPLPQFPSNRLFPPQCPDAAPHLFPPYTGCGNAVGQFDDHQRETMALRNMGFGPGLTRAAMDSWRYQFPPPAMFDHQMDPKEVATNHIKWMLNVGGNPKSPSPSELFQASFRPTITGQPRHERQGKPECGFPVNPLRMDNSSVVIGQQHRYNNAAALPRRDVGPIGYVDQPRICLVRPNCARQPENQDHPSFAPLDSTAPRETGPDKHSDVLSNTVQECQDAANVKDSRETKQALAKEEGSNYFPSSCVFDNGLGI